jgi:diaminohydroxyphosphoribosylaminopyrimidine deaminase/5-amino-6-(5-phosphoribosylamino)uracil reductase
MAHAATHDLAHMRAALALARRGLGHCWPNPSVGCVIVKDGRVAGRAVTADGGRPHAETQALAMAGPAARGSTVYVTLEPCNHTGQTPPCTEALIDAGVARVVIAGSDPDPRVSGAGIARLREAGVTVDTGILTLEADDMQEGFLSRIKRGRPMVTLKLATTLDGRIATRGGESQWLTAPPARRAAHMLRGTHDAVLAGVGTVAADDPALTCRIPGFRRTPVVRIVVDSHLRTRPTAQLVVTARDSPTWIIHREGVPADRRAAFADAGVCLIEVPGAEVGVDLRAGLAALGTAGLTRIMVEGGAQVAAGLLRAGLVDRLAWFHAPAVMGGDGWPAAQAFGVVTLDDVPRFVRTGQRVIGRDVLTEYRSAA